MKRAKQIDLWGGELKLNDSSESKIK